MSDLPKHALIENIVVYVLAVVLVLSLYSMGAGTASLWGLLLLLGINYVKSK